MVHWDLPKAWIFPGLDTSEEPTDAHATQATLLCHAAPGPIPASAEAVHRGGEGAVKTGRGTMLLWDWIWMGYESAAGGAQLAFCHIAHAEINALALLPPVRHYEDHMLLTTLEPPRGR
jgi:hypothetical protein